MADLYWSPGEDLVGPERWYPLGGYEGIYEISTFGSIRRIAGGRGVKGPMPRIMKTPPNADGYPVVNLSKDGGQLAHNVHVLVAVTFHGPKPSPDAEVDHIDGVRDHCCAANVQWLTKYDNLQKRYNAQSAQDYSEADIAAMSRGAVA